MGAKEGQKKFSRSPRVVLFAAFVRSQTKQSGAIKAGRYSDPIFGTVFPPQCHPNEGNLVWKNGGVTQKKKKRQKSPRYKGNLRQREMKSIFSVDQLFPPRNACNENFLLELIFPRKTRAIFPLKTWEFSAKR